MTPSTGQGGLDSGLLLAGLRARQSEIIGRVVEDSLDRMAEHRARRAEEQAEADRLSDRLRAHAQRERADAEAAVLAHERRRATLERAASRGDTGAALEAGRETTAAAESRLIAKRARADVLA